MSAFLENLPVKVLGLAAGVYLSEAPDPPRRYTLYEYKPQYLLTKGRGRGGSLTIDKIEGRYFTYKRVENTNITDCISPVYKLYETPVKTILKIEGRYFTRGSKIPTLPAVSLQSINTSKDDI